MKALRNLIGLSLVLCAAQCVAQVNRRTYDAVRDAVIDRFNRNDFKGIYGLFNPVFQEKVSEVVAVNFLRGNQNSGKITGSAFVTEKDRKATYLLNFELRDMLMDLELDDKGQINEFGLKNSPPILLDKAPEVKTNNPLASPLDRAIDTAVREYFRDPRAVSLSIGLIRNKQRSIYYYGHIDARGGRLPDKYTEYEIGSITKTFTAALLAQAVLDGKVKLDDDIRKYLEGSYPNLQYEGAPITLQDLATHTSGLPPMPPDVGEQASYDPAYPEAHYSASAFNKALHQVVINEAPGGKFQYSNWGMAILGHILEKVYGQQEPLLIARFITGPLQMLHTSYSSELKSADIAEPHAMNGKTLKLTDQGYFYPAGGLCTTSEDLMQYLQAQIEEVQPAIKLTHEPTVNSTGLGWGVREQGGVRDIQHSGSEQGSNANVTIYPGLHSGGFILANSKVEIGPLVLRVQQLLKNPPSN